MPGVARQLIWIAPTEVDHDWSTNRESDPLERLEVRIDDSPLDSALDHPTEASASGELGAGQAAPLAQLLDLATDPCPLLTSPTIGFNRDLRSPDARDDRHMFLPGASPALT
jgi:hypothetical protein